MRIIKDVLTLEEEFSSLVLTIGSFDGVHLGHQRILAELRHSADELKGSAALMTLSPHPRHFFAPQNAPNLLTTPEKKAELIAAFGVDILFILPFNEKISSMRPLDFVRRILLDRCRVRRLIVGHDFTFGKDGLGDYKYLQEIAPTLGFEVEQAPQLVLHGERVSSTLIREKVIQGELESAEAFLGHRYAIQGTVVSGRGIGEKLGFPTANVAPHHNAVPAHGVYAARARVEGRVWDAAVNIGVAPTIRQEDILIEAHLLDFAEGIVGKQIEIEFYKRLRPEKKFANFQALSEAIAHDVKTIREFFASQ